MKNSWIRTQINDLLNTGLKKITIMVTYDNCAIYITSASDLEERIDNIKAVMSALRDQRLNAALNDNISNYQEYSLDDGQTKIRTVYRGINEINGAIKVLERELQECYNQLNGRRVRLVDHKNFTGRRNRR